MAATGFEDSLPEVFAGYDIEFTESDPVLPEEVGWLQLDGVPGRWGSGSIRACHGTTPVGASQVSQ